MGGFPEDYEIRVSKLIKLWVAEGFLKPIESKNLEEVGEEYLEDLVNRNLVSVTKKRSNGKFKSCSIHDLLRDLCMERAHYENFLCAQDEIDYLRPEVIRNMQRLYIRPFNLVFPISTVKKCGSHVRSVLYFSTDWDAFSFMSKFKLLRVLDAQEKIFSSFPDQILELFCLRYLILGQCPIPASISKLQNLQTLRIEDENLVVQFENLKIPHLRHIMISQIQLSPILFAGEASILENLRTLSRVENFRFTNEAIEMVPNLQKLKAFYNERGLIWQKICANNLINLHQLETLGIWIFPRTKVPIDPFLEGFAFPLKLKKLSLKGSSLPWKNMTVVGSLPELQVLRLREDAFVGEEWEPIEGEFPRLKFLLMEKLDLKYWRAENIHFLCLEKLEIRYCRELQEIPLEIGEITSLELIEVHDSKLAADLALQIQEEQRDLGNDVLQVRVHDRDSISGEVWFRDARRFNRYSSFDEVNKYRNLYPDSFGDWE